MNKWSNETVLVWYPLYQLEILHTRNIDSYYKPNPLREIFRMLSVNECMNIWMNEWMNKWINQWMSSQINEWINEY